MAEPWHRLTLVVRASGGNGAAGKPLGIVEACAAANPACNQARGGHYYRCRRRGGGGGGSLPALPVLQARIAALSICGPSTIHHTLAAPPQALVCHLLARNR